MIVRIVGIRKKTRTTRDIFNAVEVKLDHFQRLTSFISEGLMPKARAT